MSFIPHETCKRLKAPQSDCTVLRTGQQIVPKRQTKILNHTVSSAAAERFKTAEREQIMKKCLVNTKQIVWLVLCLHTSKGCPVLLRGAFHGDTSYFQGLLIPVWTEADAIHRPAVTV